MVNMCERIVASLTEPPGACDLRYFRSATPRLSRRDLNGYHCLGTGKLTDNDRECVQSCRRQTARGSAHALLGYLPETEVRCVQAMVGAGF